MNTDAAPDPSAAGMGATVGKHNRTLDLSWLRTIYDGTYEYIGLLATDGTLLEANRASLEFAGSTREEVTGGPFWDAVWFANTPGAPEMIRGAVARAARGEFVRYEAPLRRPSGEWIVFDISFHPSLDEHGRVAYIVPEGRNVTERVLAQAALSHERSRIADVFEQAPVAVVVLHGRVAVELVYELANPRYLEMIPGRAPLGRRVREVLPGLDPVLLAALQGVLDTGEPFVAHDYPVLLDRDGDGALEEYFFSFVYHALTEADGSIGGIVGVGTEVTGSVRGRRETERLHQAAEAARAEAEAARARAERLQNLTAALALPLTRAQAVRVILEQVIVAVGALGGGVLELAPDSREFILLDVVGYDADEVRRSFDRFPVDLPVPARDAVHELRPVFLRSTDEWAARGYLPPDPSPSEGPGAAWAALPLVADGRAIGALTLTFAEPRPFTDEEQQFVLAFAHQCAQAVHRAALYEAERTARAQAEQARREAEAANRSKSEFLAVMSHELRTPLNAIGGYAELIEMGIRGPVTEAQREDVRRIQQSQRHLLGLINEVLNYAKIESGAAHFNVDDVLVGDTLRATEQLIAPQARAKQVSLSVGYCHPALAVRADADKLRQILLNLLSNAVKFTDAGGRVELSCEGRDEHVAFIVTDSGIGIAADQLERIFEPFVQVRADLTRTAEGTGLGLAISRDLSRHMGGDLLVTSQPGVGSTFTLVLPPA